MFHLDVFSTCFVIFFIHREQTVPSVVKSHLWTTRWHRAYPCCLPSSERGLSCVSPFKFSFHVCRSVPELHVRAKMASHLEVSSFSFTPALQQLIHPCYDLLIPFIFSHLPIIYIPSLISHHKRQPSPSPHIPRFAPYTAFQLADTFMLKKKEGKYRNEVFLYFCERRTVE